MFKEILRYEINYHFKRPLTYIFFAIFFGLAFLVVNVVGGAFENASADLGKVHFNSSYTICNIISNIVYFFLLVFPAFVGDSIHRDFKYNTYSLFFTKPISKSGYLGGRFLGSVLVLLFMFLAIESGYAFGTFMPWLNQEQAGPFNPIYYLIDFALFVLPNVIFLGSIIFCVAALSRNILLTYIACIAFYILNGVATSLVSNLDNATVSALIDPFGQQAMEEITKYWTVAEKNTRLIPFTGLLLYNRALWMGVSLWVLLMTYRAFNFSYSGIPGIFRRKKLRETAVVSGEADTGIQQYKLPEVAPVFSPGTTIKQFVSLVKFEAASILKSIPFILFVIIGILLLAVSATQLGKLYDTSTYPVTPSVLTLASGTFGLILTIFIIFFSGELVWKERSLKINQVYDALPFPNWLPMASKITTLALVEALVLFVVIITGIVIQTFKGYYNYEIDVYIKDLFGLRWPRFVMFTILAVTVQTLVNQKFIGYFIVIAYYLFLIFSGLMGLDENIYKFGTAPSVSYSAMNGFGHFLYPYLIFQWYWAALAIVLALVSALFWVRGMDTKFKLRWESVKTRINKPVIAAGLVALLFFIGIGSFIFYNTRILNDYKKPFEREEIRANYEKKYKKYENIPQPKITDVKLFADLYPKEQSGDFRGTFTMQNKSDQPINSIHVIADLDRKINRLEFNKPAKVVLKDKDAGYQIFKLKDPLKPGDSINLNFDIHVAAKGFSNSGIESPVYFNGTFINNKQVLPSIGYNPDGELSDDNTRKKHNLPIKKEQMPEAEDPIAARENFIANDANWINFEATVSTSPDQIGVAPGYLQKEWTKDGRRFFHYKMDSKILNFYSVLSADYKVKKDKWKNVEIAIYYQKGHEYNIERMIRGIKKSLDYYTTNFGPYQHKQVRILEFPYASFAQSFPNTIPFSENVGFVAKVDENDPDDVDYPFYITAHEVAHQWWGHQVVGAKSKGSAMLSESMSQYSSLMVMEKEYGKEMMGKFLKYEMDKYLRARSFEKHKELPLIDVETQPHIYYQKGGIVMYALRDYIGEYKLNAAFRDYIKEVAFQEPPFTNTRQLLKHIKAATPDSLRYIITDMLETITIYQNKTKQVSATKLADGKYRVKLEIEPKKQRANGQGEEVEVPMNDYIYVGVFGEQPKGSKKPNIIYLQKHKITNKTKFVEVIVNQKPTKAGLDPQHLLIDKDLKDNLKDVLLGANA